MPYAPPPPKRHPYDEWAPESRALDLVGDKWSLLIVRELVPGPLRFVKLQRSLPGISTEQLRSRLNRMVADRLLTRQRYREVPPRVDYELTPMARELVGVLGALSRWGSSWCMQDAEPRPRETVSISSRLCMAAALLPADGFRPHDVECVVLADGEPPDVVVVGIEREDGVARRVVRRGTERVGAETHVVGSRAAWISALAGATRAGLTIEGNMRMAGAVLDALAPMEGAVTLAA